MPLLKLNEHRKPACTKGGLGTAPRDRQDQLTQLTRAWGTWDSVSLYLRRCQVATPDHLVQATWRHVHDARPHPGKVIDFGAGDGRFSRYGRYHQYLGYEIDTRLCLTSTLPANATLINRCAFSDEITDADLCVGNPPFVRNQDLPTGWRQHASDVLFRRTGIQLSGLANAWQYFFFLALASAHEAGLCALVIPYEWVSRPSARAVRDYITAQRWNVSVYRLVDTTFSSVLTTSSITIVDKAKRDGEWTYFEETAMGTYVPMPSPTGGSSGVIPYLRRSETPKRGPHAKRGLSPGTQKALTLTEGERVRFGLSVGRDVVPCVTTLRNLPASVTDLDESSLHAYYRTPNQKSWLIRTDTPPTEALSAYLASVPPETYQTATCLSREPWWRFPMPPVPDVLIAMSFRGQFPKAVRNPAAVRAVGGVYGVYNLTDGQANELARGLHSLDIRGRVVAHSNGLRKIEIAQLNTLLIEAFGTNDGASK